MKNLLAVVTAAAVAVTSMVLSPAALAQSGTMMNDGMWGSGWMGGYGGMWLPFLLVCAAVIGVVLWVVRRK